MCEHAPSLLMSRSRAGAVRGGYCSGDTGSSANDEIYQAVEGVQGPWGRESERAQRVSDRDPRGLALSVQRGV